MTRMSNEEKYQFKILLSELKNLYASGNLNQQSKAIISELLIVLRYQVEYAMMTRIISENEQLKELEQLIEDLNNRILEYKSSIYEKNNQAGNEVMPREYLIGLVGMENNLRRLSEIRGIIRTKNYNSYIQTMNEQVKGTQQLMLITQSVLKDGYNEYFSSELIEDGNVNENVMTIIYSILKDQKLYGELRDYIIQERELESIKESIKEDQEAQEKFESIMEHESDLRRYVVLNSRVKKEENSLDKINKTIKNNEEKIHELSNQKYLKFLFNNQLKRLETDNLAMNATSTKIIHDKNELSELEDKFNSEGFESITSAFKTEIGDAETLYDKFAIFIKTKVNSTTIDISDFLSSLENRIEKKKRELELKTTALPKRLNKYSPLAKKLLLGYHDDVEKIVNLNEDENDITKLIAFYVLNLLCTSRKIKYEDLVDFNLDIEQYNQLFSKLENEIGDEVHEMSDSVRNLESEVDQIVKKAV